MNNILYSFYSTDCTDRSVISNGSVPGSVTCPHGSHGSVGARAVTQERLAFYTEASLFIASYGLNESSAVSNHRHLTPHHPVRPPFISKTSRARSFWLLQNITSCSRLFTFIHRTALRSHMRGGDHTAPRSTTSLFWSALHGNALLWASL